jgi:transposase InsO family protein
MEMRQMTKIILAHELLKEKVPKSEIAKHLKVSRRTIIRWSKSIESFGGVNYFLNHHQNAKKGKRKSRKINPFLKRRVYEIREKYYDCCGQKIQYFLKKDYGIQVSVTTIYKILNERYQLRSKWQKNQKRGKIPVAVAPRRVIQMDSVLFGGVFAFTAVDIYTRECDVLLRPALEAVDGQAFLHHCMNRRFGKHTEIIQTDGGSEFKAAFKQDVEKYCDRHRVARPYKKNEQSYIESFNRSLRKECLGWSKYQPSEIPQLTLLVEEWLQYYHYERPHISLGMRPPLEIQV